MKLKLKPMTLKQANALIGRLHRHHKPVRGHRFTIGVMADGEYVGAAVTGRPVGRETDQYAVAEVTRLVTDGTPHVCSKLYSACARAAEAMGFERIQTFILHTEPGTSLVASGWYRIKTNGDKCLCEQGCNECTAQGRDWNTPSRGGRRTDQPMVDKQRWGKSLRNTSTTSVGHGNTESSLGIGFGSAPVEPRSADGTCTTD